MAAVVRGAIHWADLEAGRGHEQAGPPILVISNDAFNERSGTAIALAITGRPPRAGYPLTWQLPTQALPRPSWVKISQVRTLSTERLGRRVARLDEDQVAEIVAGLLELIG